jgi:hypothetical protein
VINSGARRNWVAVSFGSGMVWAGARKRLFKQLNQFDFMSVEILDEAWIESSTFIPTSTKQFIKSNAKGFGYWIWKPYLIKFILQKYPECDGVFYLDIGCEFNVNQESILRFREYLLLASSFGSFAFELSEPDLHWTSTRVINELNAEAIAESNQIAATTFFLSNTPENLRFLDEWVYLCTKNNFKLLTEEESINSNFKNHRHDQSIFSLLWKMKDNFSCPNETYWAPNWATDGKSFPIWSARNRLSVSVLSSKQLRLVLRIQLKARQFLMSQLKQ